MATCIAFRLNVVDETNWSVEVSNYAHLQQDLNQDDLTIEWTSRKKSTGNIEDWESFGFVQ